jgi:hypothetical protein
MSPESIQPGGDGHIACVRVRLLHAAVRKKILALARPRPGYYDVSAFGVPINDQDTIATISTFSAQLIWIALPAQGIFMKKDEIEDYVALWRLVAHYMGTPTEPLKTVDSTKAYMESILKPELVPSQSSQVLARNIINSLANKPPTYASADYFRARARWLNGPGLSDALDIPKSSFFCNTLVAVRCLVVCFWCYLCREIPFLDRWKIKYVRSKFYNLLILGKHGLDGKETKFELQYIPGYDTVTEQGEAAGISISKPGSWEMRILSVLIVLVGILFGLVYFWTMMFMMLWGWAVRGWSSII